MFVMGQEYLKRLVFRQDVIRSKLVLDFFGKQPNFVAYFTWWVPQVLRRRKLRQSRAKTRNQFVRTPRVCPSAC